MNERGNCDREFATRALLSLIAGSPARVATSTALIWVEVFLAHWYYVIYGPAPLPGRHLAVLVSAIAASIIAGLVAATLWLHYRRQQAQGRLASEILQLNHHVRNAMQVIAYSQAHLPKPQADRVLDALNRIGDALRAISSSANPRPTHRPMPLTAFPTVHRRRPVEQIETAYRTTAEASPRVLSGEPVN